tara:strand:- start:1363 stop:3471 length:2109 start_codon:yes stop_codon:yes gene_type:complete
MNIIGHNIYTLQPAGEEWFLSEIDKPEYDWVVIPNKVFKKDLRASIKEGEIDFIVIIPNKGMVIVEVKSHKGLRLENDVFIKSDGNPLEKDTFQQTQEQRYNLMNYIKDNFPSLGYSANSCARVICAPFSELFPSKSTTFRDSELIGKEKLSESIHALIEKSLDEHLSNYSSSRTLFSTKNVESITDILFSNSYHPSKIDYEHLEENLETFDDYQKLLVELFERNQKLLFSGYPGTGKTNILIHLANKQANEGKKVIFLCYGKVLSAKLKTFDMAHENITVEPVYEYMCDLIDEHSNNPFPSLSERIEAKFWREWADTGKLQSIATETIEENEHLRFDSLIIDEAQDILSNLRSEYNVLFFDKLLRGGFKEGIWAIATDETQNIFGDFGAKYDPYELLKEISETEFTQIPLKNNYRNTSVIGDAIFNFLKEENYYDKFNRISGSTPQFIKCDLKNSEEIIEINSGLSEKNNQLKESNNNEEKTKLNNEIKLMVDKKDEIKYELQKKSLKELLDRLVKKDKVPLNKIVVLAPGLFEGSYNYPKNPLLDLDDYKDKIIEISPEYYLNHKYDEQKISYSTIQSFKGLEQWHVILNNFDYNFVKESEKIQNYINHRNIRGMKAYNYSLKEKNRSFLTEDEDNIVFKFQNYINKGWELSSDQLKILEGNFEKAIQQGYQFSEMYDRKIITSGGWRSVLGLYVIYNEE